MYTNMTKKEKLKAAFKESVTDTSIAFCINVPLNFIMVAFAFEVGMSAWQTSLMLTTVFTIFAITRKTYIRLHFEERNRKKQLKNKQVEAINA